MKDEVQRGSDGGRREESGDAPRYTGSRLYRLFLYPEQIIFFVFQRAWGEALIVTALLSCDSGKLRSVKAPLRQASPSPACNYPRRVANEKPIGGLIGVDFPATYIAPSRSFLFGRTVRHESARAPSSSWIFYFNFKRIALRREYSLGYTKEGGR